MINDDNRSRVDGDGGGRPAGSDDLLGRLIRLADDGPEIPGDGADRIKAAIRPAWHAELRFRARRRRALWIGTGLAAAAGVVLAVMVTMRSVGPAPVAAAPVARLEVVTGEMEILAPDGAPVRVDGANLGHQVVAGSWLRTGSTTRAALELEGGQSVRLDAGTRVRLASVRAMTLDRGALYVDSDGGGDAGVEVHSSHGVARDIGTQFEVRLEQDALTVRVREGAVSLSTDSEELQVAHGTLVTVAADGARQVGRVQSYAPAWAWVQEVAPTFEIEGRSVVAFLDWVSRETGLWVSFADQETESFASTTTLHGTIDGMRPDQAPEIVLAGCGLEVTRGPGVLVVGRLREGAGPGS